jgi:thioredoxin 1
MLAGIFARRALFCRTQAAVAASSKGDRETVMANDKIVTVKGENFESEVLKSDVPVLVDFWAEWCGPCRMVAPVLDELANEMDGKLRVAKLNVDENQQIAYQFQVSSIPTFILFKDGKMADRMMGAMPKSAFQNFIQRNLEESAPARAVDRS